MRGGGKWEQLKALFRRNPREDQYRVSDEVVPQTHVDRIMEFHKDEIEDIYKRLPTYDIHNTRPQPDKMVKATLHYVERTGGDMEKTIECLCAPTWYDKEHNKMIVIIKSDRFVKSSYEIDFTPSFGDDSSLILTPFQKNSKFVDTTLPIWTDANKRNDTDMQSHIDMKYIIISSDTLDKAIQQKLSSGP